ncbi:universal stress protein [Mycolicibacterium flavescens]|uniref:UspA domain-containing protein n=1 Tax=Mycolicibacterium flavescens TaxID=1776 RepID=A0A1E3R8A8_MYCFV|nr:universal stress protein [Mycolicibacterium flavescens]MCV7282619.1 universal stress protein [Mycolicibacterium flavescens]ODQ86093.1 hypothetical protein BHQ18_27490 [Mycolicibacterium flavescens]
MDPQSHPVVVGVDGSQEALQAARWAAAAAERLDAPLCVVHARPYSGHNPSDTVAAVRVAERGAARETADSGTVLAAAQDAIGRHHTGVNAEFVYIAEPVDEVLVRLSVHATMVVLGCGSVSPGAAILVGSTTVAVVSRAQCPVVAWRGDVTEPDQRPIVVGVNGDDDARIAVTAAFELADRFGAGVVAVHAGTMARSAEESHLSAVIDPLVRLYPDVEVTLVVDKDKPARALLRQLDGAQLVIVGSRGRGLLTGALLGSTGLNLLHHSPVPAMICRSSRASHD